MDVSNKLFILWGRSGKPLPAFTTGAAQSVTQAAQVKMAGYCTATQAFGLIFGPLVSTYLYQFDQNLPFHFLFALMILVGICIGGF